MGWYAHVKTGSALRMRRLETDLGRVLREKRRI
jgi:hypothetical protein